MVLAAGLAMMAGMVDSRDRRRVVVLGGGVVGLSAAIRLAEDPARRFAVELVAEQLAGESLSRAAAASFYPYAVDHPRLGAWLEASLAEFVRLAEDPSSGVAIRRCIELHPAKLADAGWRDWVLNYRRGIPADVVGVGPRFVDAHVFEAPIIDMPVYLPWLLKRFQRAGGSVRRATVTSLLELAAPDVILVHCSGVRARRLLPDPEVKPSLGQIVRIERGPFQDSIADELAVGGATYIVPRTRDCVLGTIDVPWDADALGYEPPPPRAEVTARILERCAELDPRVRAARVLESYCGLRPKRATVRVELDAAFAARGLRVIHDYGHGGGGVTLSWGSAADVVELAGTL